MGRRGTLLIVLTGSAALLLGAFGFQHLAGLDPCPLCVRQRYPHGVVIALAGLALLLRWRGMRARVVLGLIGVALLITAMIAIEHVGVEQGLWLGDAGCTGGQAVAPSLADLDKQLQGPPPPRCDEAAWTLFGLSLAAYNAVFSLALAAVAAIGAARRTE
jgi:disulfide bond formation protein DsbB